MDLLKRKSREMYDWFGGLFVTKARHYTTLTGDTVGSPGEIVQYHGHSQYQQLISQQQMALAQQQAQQHYLNQQALQAQQMGVATAGMGALLGQLHARPQPPTPAPFPPPAPVEEPKPEEVPVEEPEFEEVTKEDGTTVLRLKK
jgi:hypothetical protein